MRYKGLIFIFITGYHGTSSIKNADNIIEKGYNISKTEKNWLGDGIYFYPNFEDAYNWKNITTNEKSEAILHSIIKIDEDELLDLDTKEGRYLLNNIFDELGSFTDVTKIEDVEERQCAVMRFIWETSKKINVIACKFSPQKTKVRILTDPREKRKEFCVRDNSYIVNTILIKRSDINV